jgi:hypothetical protein
MTSKFAFLIQAGPLTCNDPIFQQIHGKKQRRETLLALATSYEIQALINRLTKQAHFVSFHCSIVERKELENFSINFEYVF